MTNGADPNIRTNEGYTALTFAAKQNDFNCIELLLNYGAKPDIKTLKFAAVHGSRLCLNLEKAVGR